MYSVAFLFSFATNFEVLVCSTVACAAGRKRSSPTQRGSSGYVKEVDVLDLADDTVRTFVEEIGYPVMRGLISVMQTEDEEILTPGPFCPPSINTLGPHNWAPFEGLVSPDEAHRLFYKLNLGGHCSEVSYLYLALFNAVKDGVRQRPVFRGQEIKDMKLCIGFVTHKYRKLTLEKDFGLNYWQHSREVHCGARNHVWLEFSLVGTAGDFVLDLTGIQFDMTGPKDMKYIHVHTFLSNF